jgi:hypothetical protein
MDRREQKLARTYGQDRDGWERVREFRRVREFVDGRPDVGSGVVAARLDLPRSRVRPWVDGESRPDPVRAVQRAWDLGWLEARPGDPVFEALAVCNAWIFAGGSIAAENYRPTFAVGASDPEEPLLEAIETLGLDYRRYRREVDRRATEIAPTDHGVLLGRYLAGVLDAPIGPKDDEGGLGLPLWLSTTPTETRRRWARTYVTVRGYERTDRGGAVQLVERRPDGYRQALSELFADLVDCPESVTLSGERTVYLHPPAADRLHARPMLGSGGSGATASD